MTKKPKLARGTIDAGHYAAAIVALPPSDGGGYLASAVELPGCIATGETEAEALAELRDAIRSWVRTALEFGDPVPPPLSKHRYSGKFIVRVPASLHRSLALRASLEGVSLNQLVGALLSGGVSTVPRSRGRRKAA